MHKLLKYSLFTLPLVIVALSVWTGCSKTANTGPGTVVETTLYDFEYLRFRYFWLFDPFTDTVFANRVARGDSIIEFRLYRTADFENTDIEPQGLVLPRVPSGLTIDDARSADTTYDNFQRKGILQLIEAIDYYIDPRQYWLTLSDSNPLQESMLVGFYVEIRTPTGVDTIGVMAESLRMTPDSVSLILTMLKSDSRVDPTNPTWLLEWKNVYDIGIRNFLWERVNVDVCRGVQGAPCETLLSPGQTPFREILGLDRVSSDGCLVPDGWIDDDLSILDRRRGHVIFPNSFPFAPSTYPVTATGDPLNSLGDQRSYAINGDTLGTEAPGLYGRLTQVNRQEASKYRLVITERR